MYITLFSSEFRKADGIILLFLVYVSDIMITVNFKLKFENIMCSSLNKFPSRLQPQVMHFRVKYLHTETRSSILGLVIRKKNPENQGAIEGC